MIGNRNTLKRIWQRVRFLIALLRLPGGLDLYGESAPVPKDSLRRGIHSFLRDQGGAVMVEYGLLAGLIAAAGLVGLSSVGLSIGDIFDVLSGTLNANPPGAS